MLNIRPATPADVPTMLRFIHELATYEREPDAVIATEADLLRDGFSLAPDGTPLDSPIRFRALIADYSESPNEPVASRRLRALLHQLLHLARPPRHPP